MVRTNVAGVDGVRVARVHGAKSVRDRGHEILLVRVQRILVVEDIGIWGRARGLTVFAVASVHGEVGVVPEQAGAGRMRSSKPPVSRTGGREHAANAIRRGAKRRAMGAVAGGRAAAVGVECKMQEA